MTELFHDWRSRISMVAAFLPLMCFLPIMIACEDQSTEGSPRSWENAALIYSVAASFLLPLALIGTRNRTWMIRLRDALVFTMAWVAMQVAVLFALSLISVALFGDGP